MVLTGPMIGIAPERLGMPQPVARILVEAFAIAGFGKAYVPGGSDRAEEMRPFSDTILTSDQERFGRTGAVIEAAPLLALGSPTIGWLKEALRSCSALEQPQVPRHIKVPLLLVSAGSDRIVSLPAIARLGSGLKIGAHVTIASSRHEILMERDEIRARFWAAFDAYLGISAEAA
jgi:lysophospholipase